MRSTVRCECGAAYDRKETQTLIRIRDPFVCIVCGRELEPWMKSRKAAFTLIRRPANPKMPEGKG